LWRKKSKQRKRHESSIDHSQKIYNFFNPLPRAAVESAVDEREEEVDERDIAFSCRRSLLEELFCEDSDIDVFASDYESGDQDEEKVDIKKRPSASTHADRFSLETAITYLSTTTGERISSCNSKDAKYDRKHTFYDRLVCKALSTYFQLRKNGYSKMEASIDIAGHLFEKVVPMTKRKDSYRAQCIRQWATDFLFDGRLPQYFQGKHTKTDTVISQEPVQFLLKEHLRSMNDFQRTPENFMNKLNSSLLRELPGARDSVCVETARNWMHLLGFHPTKLCKSYYTDDHNRSDVVKYRDEVFLAEMAEYEKRMRKYEVQGDGTTRVVEPVLKEGEKNVVLVTHDESTFYSNECSRMVWMENGY
jgi:hypothetical protein